MVWMFGLGSPLPWAYAQSTGGTSAARDLTTAVTQVAKQTIPAVVHIEVTERQEVTNPFSSFGSDPFFRFFFNAPQMPKKFKREVTGLGTGIIMDAQGHIVTNSHVAAGASKMEVLLANGQKYPARLVGADPKTDLAVIKIEAKESLPYVTFGDSDTAEVGEWVVAIGHPRGLDQTVTQGIISAKHRRGITDPSSYQDFLQTDAAINPGNGHRQPIPRLGWHRFRYPQQYRRVCDQGTHRSRQGGTRLVRGECPRCDFRTGQSHRPGGAQGRAGV